MADPQAGTLGKVARVLRFGALAALALGVVVFVFAFLAHGLNWQMGLDWVRKLLLLLGALALITGGCGLLVSGRDRPSGTMTPHEDDTFRMFWHEVGMPWGAAVSLTAVDFLLLGTVADLLYFSLV
ncbi:hypothetical protein [Thermophilibacter provencensis]|uniref:Uncharacterized protein n=1 Tax=Thermophilibacter provencensis TaxID=1852386 RepID=A0ABT7V5I5_9ACTN|nr:hypothetical protein [Thermophilibacter provencensis]MDM8271864.1 hypothetical protein [Thermophilibacter provencensis]